MSASWFLLLVLPVAAIHAQTAPPADALSAGRKTFEGRCSGCHGADGNGGELGPPIARRVANRDDAQLTALVRDGLPTRGMPPNKVADSEMRELITFLRSLRPRRFALQQVRGKVELPDGKPLEGLIINQSFEDMQMRTDDNRIHLLRKTGGRYREVTSDTGWPTYNGQPGGNRFTTLDQINKSNIARLAPKWTFNVPNTAYLETTPVVVDGIMYVTAANECYALDAGSGRQIWHFQRPRTPGLIGNAASGINRGVALAVDRIFIVTDNAHLLALQRFTGDLMWETEMADWHQNYNATSAPLIVGNLVVSGTAGGEEGVRGFVAAYDQSTGKEAWRFWTVPKEGEPGSETWQGKGIEHGGSVTWFTGTYDPELDLIFWPTGNPGDDYNGDDRGGDNLYSDCILALDAKTGKLKWHYQTTPHDLWDWDATETPVVVNANWNGQPRKLLIQANRNGFFYVLDRSNGELLLAKQFIRKLTWASGIGPDGRPIKIPGQEPSAKGTTVCPSQDGATNWFSPSFNPATGLFYVQTYEKCSIYTKRDPGPWEAGRTYLGGAQRGVFDPQAKPERILRAIDIQTGAVKWELSQVGPAVSWGGTLATSTGLVIFGEDSGALMAAEATTGKPLWSFQTNALWKASPMTYSFDGRQYIGVAAGSNIIAFGVVE
jgi:alcohol dehydrogenase (cytochrome c)